ncbi:TetR/AcrR family transcriptional regulator [Hoeflea sp. TYP-13]|uniref:TetR/AcrR family transcriptional regulator n=1 Tax=Hoeflea sp. TYP-13 TaxID=3230023 RepID=UPI0034C640BF
MGEVSDKTKALGERKSRIIAAAVGCFLENGYNQTGIREIAKKAGISLGNLYNHFRSKEDVLAEIAVLEREELQPFQRLLTDHDDPMKTLMRFVSEFANYTASEEYAVLSIEIAAEAVHNPEIASLFMANRSLLVTSLQALLEKGQADKCFRNFADSKQTAELILDTIEGYALREYLTTGRKILGTEELGNFIRHATCR